MQSWYFDSDKRQLELESKWFSDVEKGRLSDISYAINEVLARYHFPLPGGDNEVIGYVPIISTCRCGKSIIIYNIDLKSPVLSMEEIHDIAEALDRLKICLINISANFRVKQFSLHVGEIHAPDNEYIQPRYVIDDDNG